MKRFNISDLLFYIQNFAMIKIYVKYKINQLFLFILIGLSFISCEENGVDPFSTEEIWPLKSGNVWRYRVEHPSWIKDTLKMEITGSMDVTFQGQNYNVMKMAFYSINEPLPEYQWLYWKGLEGIYAMGGVSPTDTFIVKELEIKYPASVGDSWQYRSVAYSLNKKEFYISDTLTYSLVGDNITVQTPAGNFKCFQYRFSQKPADDVGDIWDYNFYYSLEMGLVRQETISQLELTTKGKFSLINN